MLETPLSVSVNRRSRKHRAVGQMSSSHSKSWPTAKIISRKFSCCNSTTISYNSFTNVHVSVKPNFMKLPIVFIWIKILDLPVWNRDWNRWMWFVWWCVIITNFYIHFIFWCPSSELLRENSLFWTIYSDPGLYSSSPLIWANYWCPPFGVSVRERIGTTVVSSTL